MITLPVATKARRHLRTGKPGSGFPRLPTGRSGVATSKKDTAMPAALVLFGGYCARAFSDRSETL
jgi:hypothetical protein